MAGTLPARPRLILVGASTIIAVLYLLFAVSSVWLLMAMHAATHARIMSATQELPQSDFARFWYAGKRLVMQRAADFGIAIPPSPWFKATFQIDILSPAAPPGVAWLYPPTMGVLAMLFAAAPLAASFWLWRIFSIAAAVFFLRRAGLGWLPIAAGLASPAALHDLVAGQNGTLLAGLFVSSLLCVAARPRLGGALAGLLCIKPQAAIALPVILLQRRYSTALRWCLGAAAALVALSILLEGWRSWVWFFTIAQPASGRVLNLPLDRLAPGGYTVLMMARSLHATVAQAWALQAISSGIAAILLRTAWTRPNSDPVTRMALTVSLAALLTPYGYFYDLVGFSIGMAAMAVKSPMPQKPVFAALWLFGGYTNTLQNLTGFVLMPLAAAVGAWLIWHGVGSDHPGDPKFAPANA